MATVRIPSRTALAVGRFDEWTALFSERQSELNDTATLLTEEGLSSSEVVAMALAELDDISVHRGFEFAFAIRIVARLALRQSRNKLSAFGYLAPPRIPKPNASLVSTLMAVSFCERAVFFLREVLQYSRRETALLLRISDSDVDCCCQRMQEWLSGSDLDCLTVTRRRFT